MTCKNSIYGRQINTSNNYLISSNNWPDNIELTGIFSDNINNKFHNYSKIYIKYCSSDIYMGNSSSMGFYFDGINIFRETIRIFNYNLYKATNILFCGTSAGGIGMIYHFSYLKNKYLLANVKGLNDGGFLVNINTNINSYMYSLKYAFKLWNSNMSDFDPLIYHNNFIYDQNDIFYILNIPDAFLTLIDNNIYDNTYINKIISKSKDLYFLSNFFSSKCKDVHSFIPMGNDNNTSRSFYISNINNITLSMAFEIFYFDNKNIKLYDNCDHICNLSCPPWPNNLF